MGACSGVGRLVTELVERLMEAVGDRYRVEREIASGATALVCLARDTRHDRLVVLKLLRPELSSLLGPGRFEREIEIVSRLSHPNILPLYDSADAKGVLYFVMPYVEGGSLRDRLNAVTPGPLPTDEALRIAMRVARALDFAHGRGVVHRDIKPENILLHEGEPMVADFGIAVALASLDDDDRLTGIGMSLGTPAYMSPEQAAGERTIDRRSDIYSLACVLFEMLTGRPPFTGGHRQGVIGKHLTMPPPKLRELRPDLPEALEIAIDRGLAKSPGDRFASAGEFSRALEQALGPDGPRLTPTTGVAAAIDPSPRRRARMIAGFASALVAALAVALVATRGGSMRSAGATTKLQPHDWVVVADVQSASRDRSIANVVYDIVTTELNQSQFVRTVSREQLSPVMSAAGIPDTAAVTERVARNLAERSNVRAVVVGNVESLGAPGFAITLRVKTVRDGEELVAVTGQATPEKLVKTVGELTADLLVRLGEKRDSLAAPLLPFVVATSSLDAYRKYIEALRLSEQGDDAGSNEMGREAIKLDTGFAAAWALVGDNYRNLHELDSARFAFAEALRRPKRLSDAHRYVVLGDAAYAIEYDLPAAVRWLELSLNSAPNSYGTLNNRALYLSLLGRYDEARLSFQRALSESPFGNATAQPVLLNETAMLIALGRLDSARSRVPKLTGPYAQYARLELASAAGTWARAESLAIAPLTAPATPGWVRDEASVAFAGALAARGAVRAADSVLLVTTRRASISQRHFFDHARLLLSLASTARVPADLIRETERDSSPGGIVVRALAAARHGDAATALALLRRLRALPPAVIRRIGTGPLLIEAEIASHGARWSEVTRLLAAPALAGEHDNANVDRVPGIVLRWVVADAYGHLARRDSAMAYMTLAMSPVRVPPGHQALRGLIEPFAELRLARWNAESGDLLAARKHLAGARGALRNADADVRMQVENTALAIDSLLAKLKP